MNPTMQREAPWPLVPNHTFLWIIIICRRLARKKEGTSAPSVIPVIIVHRLVTFNGAALATHTDSKWLTVRIPKQMCLSLFQSNFIQLWMPVEPQFQYFYFYKEPDNWAGNSCIWLHTCTNLKLWLHYSYREMGKVLLAFQAWRHDDGYKYVSQKVHCGNHFNF